MSVNKVILIGNVGKDPEVRYLDSGVAVAQFSLATSERGYTNSQGIQVPDRTEWHNIVLWRGLADIAEKYVRKGSKIYLEGKIRTRTYEDQAGVRRYVTEIFGDNLELLDRRESQPQADSGVASAQQGYTSAPTSAKAQSTPISTLGSNDPAAEDDLPF
ncbi:MAG: single-stranded DNA-binding protein [Bacteroidales bacterium]